MSSVYFFLVAEASAISSAPKTMSRGTFFSRASTSTSITSSRFPVATFNATLPSSQFRHQLRPLHVRERQRHYLSVQFNLHAAPVLAPQNPYEPPPPRRVRRAHPHFRPLARKTREVSSLAQRPVETGRGHFQPLVFEIGRASCRERV